jgi:monofunctional biosynthetic peptidoglycan transglycosylase
MARDASATRDEAGAGRRAWPRRILATLAVAVAGLTLLIAALAKVPPPSTPYILWQGLRHGPVERAWVPIEAMAPVVPRAVVAAEDANFCRHWGFDMAAIRAVIEAGGRRGASTISQQTVKNVFLWQGRSWPRKALEAAITPAVEALWSKRRILEVYLNVAEMGPGVFGIEAAARHWFGVPAAELSGSQAARIAAILPAPTARSPAEPSDFVRRRGAQILDGAETIRRDGRAACFEA